MQHPMLKKFVLFISYLHIAMSLYDIMRTVPYQERISAAKLRGAYALLTIPMHPAPLSAYLSGGADFAGEETSGNEF